MFSLSDRCRSSAARPVAPRNKSHPTKASQQAVARMKAIQVRSQNHGQFTSFPTPQSTTFHHGPSIAQWTFQLFLQEGSHYLVSPSTAASNRSTSRYDILLRLAEYFACIFIITASRFWPEIAFVSRSDAIITSTFPILAPTTMSSCYCNT